jgi:glycosyltransferase involved in cell wall biosynthesis
VAPLRDAVFFSPWIGPVAAPTLFPDTPSAGGSETQTWMIAQGLAARGRSVAVVARRGQDAYPSRIDGVEMIEQRPPRRSDSRAMAYAAYPATIAPIWHRLDGRVMIQRAAGAETGLTAAVALIRRRPFIYSSAAPVDFDYSTVVDDRLRLHLFEWGLRRASEIVVQTRDQSDLCRRKLGRPGVIIPSIAVPASPQPRASESFVWLGRLAQYKNPLAYLELARAVPEASFTMVAVPSDNDELRRQVEDAAATLTNLELLDAMPHDDAVALMDRAVAVVSTSDFEGMPNVFLEGWARGIPALALSHDPDGIIAGERIGAVAGGDRDRFTDLARQFWAARNSDAELAERCRAYVRREHSIGRVLDKWEAVIDGVAAKYLP